MGFKIGDTEFESLSSASGRKARYCDPGFPEQETRKFHLPGTTGNLVIMSGSSTRVMRFYAQYRGADVATVGGLLTTDRAAWLNTEISCITDEGETVTRCIVTAVKRGRFRATGRGVTACDVEIVVESNAGA